MAYTKTSSIQYIRTKIVNGVSTPWTNTYTGNTRTGQSMPDWRNKIKQGLNATTPYYLNARKIVEAKYGKVSVTYSQRPPNPPAPVTHTVEGYYNSSVHLANHLAASTVSANNKALAILNRKMNGQISQLNAPAVFAEALDVVRQFGRPFQSIVDLTERHLNRLYLQKRGILAVRYNKKQLTRILADTYLEYAFGLAPLINDTKKAAEALARFAWEQTGESRQPLKMTARGQDELSFVHGPSTWVASPSLIVLRRDLRTVTQARAQYICGFSSFPTADFGSHDRLMQLLGFRPESWIPAVWEAVPWSWLVDYFSNVQELLNSLEASVIKPTWISKTVTQVTDTTYDEFIDTKATIDRLSSAYSLNTDKITGTLLSHTKVRRTTLTRSAPSTVGYPTLEFGLPDSWRQIANMSAVLLTKRKSTPAISLETSYRNLLRG